MQADWQAVEFDPETASPELWQMYHSYRRARWEERGDPDEPYVPDDIYAETARQERQEKEWEHFDAVVIDSDRVIAALGGGAERPDSPNYGTNGHILWVFGAVLGPWRRRGIGQLWLEYALSRMPVTGARLLTAQSTETDGQAFLEAVCGEPRQLVRYSRASFPDLDWVMVDRWVAESADRAPGYHLEIHEHRLPETLWPEYLQAKEEQGRHIPRDGLDMGDWLYTTEFQSEMYKGMDIEQADHHVIWVRDPAGTIVAITDVGWYPHTPDQLQQFFTGVHPDARGLGLGKLVKARMLQLARERYAEQHLRWVRTDNATTNAAMLAINERLGFREYKVAGIYQAEKDQIERFLVR